MTLVPEDQLVVEQWPRPPTSPIRADGVRSFVLKAKLSPAIVTLVDLAGEVGALNLLRKDTTAASKLNPVKSVPGRAETVSTTGLWRR